MTDERRSGQLRRCRRCRRYFYLSADEQKRYRERGHVPPEHCPVCRTYRRENRDPYEGWEGTMAPAFQRKKRHSRVHYAPYVVGGMRG